MLEQAEAKVERWAGRYSVRLANDPFLSIPCEPGSVDLVVTAYAIHHLPDADKRRAIAEMARVLRPGGTIAVADTMFADEEAKQRALATYADLEDEYHPHLDTFLAMFEAEGMAVRTHRVGETVCVVIARRG